MIIRRSRKLPTTFVLGIALANIGGFVLALIQGFPNWIWFVVGGSAPNFCPENSPTFFDHCFPDFGTFFFLPSDNPWAWDFPHSHPPLAQWIQGSFIALGQWVGLDYLAMVAIWIVLLVSAIYISLLNILKAMFLPSFWLYLLPILFLPNIATYFNLWTGNSTGLVLPFLSLACTTILKESKFAWAWVGIAVSLRPQLVFLLAVLILRKDWRQVGKAVATAISLTTAALLTFRAPVIDLIGSWLTNLANYPLYASPFMYSPDSLGIGRSLVKLLELPVNLLLGGITQNDSASELEWLSGPLRLLSNERSLLIPVLLALVATLAPIVIRRAWRNAKDFDTFEILLLAILAAIILPSTSFPYYGLLVLPLSIAVIGHHLGLEQVYREKIKARPAVMYGLPLILLSLPLPVSILRSSGVSDANLISELSGLAYLWLFLLLAVRLVVGQSGQRLNRSC